MIRFRARPEDFVVEEELLYPPDGSGEHTYLRVRKRNRTTEQVARQIARHQGVSVGEVRYAGRKDRFALTTQWFSVSGPVRGGEKSLDLDGAEVLEVSRHAHRLVVGDVLCNRFVLRLRETEGELGSGPSIARPTEPAPARSAGMMPAEGRASQRSSELATELRARLAVLERWGFPNRFGRQRFGVLGDNAKQGRALLSGERTMRNRRLARFLVSSFQAEVFNQVLLARAELIESEGSSGSPAQPGLGSRGSLEGPRLGSGSQVWPLKGTGEPGRRSVDRVLRGDLVIDHYSGVLRPVELPESFRVAVEAFEVSPTGPLFGRRARRPSGEVERLEERVLRDCGVDLGGEGPRGLEPPGGRRALRERPQACSVEALGQEGVELGFELPAGVYATVLLEELFGEESLCEGPPQASSS